MRYHIYKRGGINVPRASTHTSSVVGRINSALTPWLVVSVHGPPVQRDRHLSIIGLVPGGEIIPEKMWLMPLPVRPMYAASRETAAIVCRWSRPSIPLKCCLRMYHARRMCTRIKRGCGGEKTCSLTIRV